MIKDLPCVCLIPDAPCYTGTCNIAATFGCSVQNVVCFLVALLCTHLPKFCSQYDEPCENYKIKSDVLETPVILMPESHMTSSDVFGHSLWRLHGECPKTCAIIVMQERKGEENTGKPEPPQKQSNSRIFRRTRTLKTVTSSN